VLSRVIRPLCLALWVVSAVTGYIAVTHGDRRLLLAQIAQALFAVVLWSSLRPGAEWFEPPRFGTRGLRLVLYSTIVATSLAASVSWPLFSSEPGASNSTGLFLLALVGLGPFLYAERKGRAIA